MNKERLIELIQEADKKGLIFYRDNEAALNFANFILNDGWIRPPCKVGDRVYMVIHDKRTKKPLECNVIGFWYTNHEDCCTIHLSRYVDGKFDSTFSVRFTDIGKTVFFTKKEAEAKLKESENNA